MTYETIQLAMENGLATMTLNRPGRLNAITPAMADEIRNALDHIQRADGTRALLITGAGRGFCAGADLAERARQTLEPHEAGYKVLTEHYNPLLLALSRLSFPVVSAVNGPAVGIGCALALAADFVVMAKSAYLLQAFVNIGLAGDGGSAWTLQRLAGRARAAQMLMLGERIAPQTAVEWGLAYRCVDDAALLDEALALARRLAAGPTRALGLIRASLADGFAIDYATVLQREAEVRRSLSDSPDTSEGGQAFLEKRKPRFIGQ